MFFKNCLAWQGYRVLVVEQTETPEQMEIRRREEGLKDKVCLVSLGLSVFFFFFFWG